MGDLPNCNKLVENKSRGANGGEQSLNLPSH